MDGLRGMGAARRVIAGVLCATALSACALFGEPAERPVASQDHATPAVTTPPDPPPSPTASPSAVPSLPAPPPLPPPDPALIVDDRDDVPEAVVRIEATGQSYDPYVEETYDLWQGSGFLIDSDGTAVTNAHVAASADSLTAYVGGSATPVRAKILGFAPCVDVAMIQLAGSGYRWLPWAPEPPRRGQRGWTSSLP